MNIKPLIQLNILNDKRTKKRIKEKFLRLIPENPILLTLVIRNGACKNGLSFAWMKEH